MYNGTLILDNPLTVLMLTVNNNNKQQTTQQNTATHFSLFSSRSDSKQEVLVGGVRGIIGQLPEDVCTRGGSDVHVVGEGCAVRRGAGEWVLLGGKFWTERAKKSHDFVESKQT